MDPAECGLGSHLVYRVRERAGCPSRAGVVQREQTGRFYYRSVVALTDAAPRGAHKWMSAVAALVVVLAAALHPASHLPCSKPALLASHPRQQPFLVRCHGLHS